METIYFTCSLMVSIHLLTVLHQFFFLYGYHSSYQLIENCPTKRGDDYFHYNVFKYMIFFVMFVLIYNVLLKTSLSLTYVRFITINLRTCTFIY